MRFAVLISSVTLMACYQYVPVESVRPQPGMDARVQVSSEKAEELGLIGDNGTFLLTGELLRFDGDTVGIRVPERGWRSAQIAVRAHRTFLLPRNTVIGVERKQMRKWETAALFAGGLGVLAFLTTQVEVNQQGTFGEPSVEVDVSLVKRFP